MRARLLTLALHLSLLGATAFSVVLPLNASLEASWVGEPAKDSLVRDEPPPVSTSLSHQRVESLLALTPRVRAEKNLTTSLPPFSGRLLGTLVSPERKRSLASVLLPNGRTISAQEGDEVLDGTILSIERACFEIARAGRQEWISLDAGVDSRPLAPKAFQAPIRLSENEFTVSRSAIAARLNDLMGLAREVHIIPAFRNGAAIGFRLAGLRPESELTQLGLQTGDILVSVNGESLSSAERVFGLVGALNRATQVDLQIERSGQVLTHHYRLN